MRLNLPLILIPLGVLTGWRPITLLILSATAVYIYFLDRKSA